MAKYFHTSNDNKPHYDDLFTTKKAKPFEGVVYSFWNENYTGERNPKKERHGNGSVEWNLDVTGQWRFEEWALDQHFGPDHKDYDYDDKQSSKIINALESEIKSIKDRFKRAKNKKGDSNFEI